jgi:protein-S-isoprenylcysteine O-methyltransferase Ste14
MKQKKGEHPFGDAGQLILLGIFIIVWAGDSFFLYLSTFLADSISLFVGLALLAISIITGVLLFNSAHVVVKDDRPDYVVSTSAFKYVRHPVYLSAMLFYLGLFFSTLSLLSLAFLLVILIFYNYIASYEEKLLESRFGEEYLKYSRRTGKWFPKF